tara:strand:- start:275 stop:520 length:246 start_codon:yes stop_codon:yes gene_type:complete
VKNIYHAEDKKVILFGYSKGSADMVSAICLYGELLKPMLAGVISMMGAVGGCVISSQLLSQNRDKLLDSIMDKVVERMKCR